MNWVQLGEENVPVIFLLDVPFTLYLDRREALCSYLTQLHDVNLSLRLSQGLSPIPFFMKVFLGPPAARKVPPPFLTSIFSKVVRRALSHAPHPFLRVFRPSSPVAHFATPLLWLRFLLKGGGGLKLIHTVYRWSSGKVPWGQWGGTFFRASPSGKVKKKSHPQYIIDALT